MVRESFSKHIKELEEEVMQMGRMVIDAINRSVEALKNLDINAAQQVISNDALINKKRWDLEEKCIDLIATQQPVASDLREIVAVLFVAGELERMGDYAEGIGRIAVMHGSEPLLKPLVDIPRMAEVCISMLEKSLDAFRQRDADSAEVICNEDDQVEQLYEQVYRVLLSYMIEDPRTITKATHLIWAAHNLERIGDRVTNICERTVFLATGIMKEIGASRY
jgi:phosphate transport system protein